MNSLRDVCRRIPVFGCAARDKEGMLDMRYLVSGKQAAEIDRHTIEEVGVPQLVLMERAALAVAEETAALIKDRDHDRILVVAESGNNGGDGIAAARILHQRGYSVEVWLLEGLAKQSDAYKKQKELAKKAGVPFVDLSGEAGAEPGVKTEDESDVQTDAEYDVEIGVQSGVRKGHQYSVIMDAIFGVGLTRDVTGVQAQAVTWINARRAEGAKVVAVDIPTGLSSESGEVLGKAVTADRTVTFGFEKVGMLLAKDAVGTVSIPEIGFFLPEEFRYYTYDRTDVRRLLPSRSREGNKGSFGRVMVVAGSKDMSGAAYLAAEAAYRTGCGLVKVVTHESNRPALQQLLPEAILKTYGDGLPSEVYEKSILTEQDMKWADVIILGPGIGTTETALQLTEQILRNAACPVIVDADAINLLADHTKILEETAGSRPLIMTPHMLEMTRLTEKSSHPVREALARLKKERIAIAEAAARMYGATVVLKDAATFVTEGTAGGYLNSSGNDAMAKGGSGDVLTGVIAGLLAQGLAAPQAARLGVYLHGLAGDTARERLGAYSVIARDLLDSVPDVMRQE